MRAVAVSICSAFVLAAPCQQLLWSVRHGNPGNTTGFGDVGLGISLRHDSLLVGRSYNNAPALDLLRTDGSTLWSFSQPDTVQFEGGSCFLGDGALLAYRCVMNGGQGLRILDLSFEAPTPDWSFTFHDFEVDQVAGPVGAEQGSKAWLVASGQRNDSALIQVFACNRLNGVVNSTTLPTPYPVLNLHTSFMPGHGLLVDAMLMHPDAFSAVPWEVLIDTSDHSIAWSTYLTDTTGFLVNAPAITVPWAPDTLITAITTWSSQLRLAFRSTGTGQFLSGTTDTLGITPDLTDLLVADSAVLVATTNRFLMRYDAALHGEWTAASFINSYYPGMKMVPCPGGITVVNGRMDGTTIGQDVEVSRYDGSSGALVAHFLFNDPVTNTHDILHGAVASGDSLFLLSAATYDTLNILNERTELSLTAFLLDGAAQVEGQLPTSHPIPEGVVTDRLEGVLPPDMRAGVLTDMLGRVVARGNAAQLDAVYRHASAGPYLVRATTHPTAAVRVVRP